MIGLIQEIIADIFRAIGMAYYGFISQLGYFERGMIIILIYSSIYVWAKMEMVNMETVLTEITKLDFNKLFELVYSTMKKII